MYNVEGFHTYIYKILYFFFGLFQLKCGIHWQSYVPYDYYHTPHRLYCSNKFISEISEASRQAAPVNRQDII